MKTFDQGTLVLNNNTTDIHVTVLVTNSLGLNGSKFKFKGVVVDTSNEEVYSIGEYSETWDYKVFDIVEGLYLKTYYNEIH